MNILADLWTLIVNLITGIGVVIALLIIIAIGALLSFFSGGIAVAVAVALFLVAAIGVPISEFIDKRKN